MVITSVLNVYPQQSILILFGRELMNIQCPVKMFVIDQNFLS